MKKVVLSLAVLFSVALVSCGGQKAEAVDSDTVVAEEVVVEEDTMGDSVVLEAAAAVDTAVVAAE